MLNKNDLDQVKKLINEACGKEIAQAVDAGMADAVKRQAEELETDLFLQQQSEIVKENQKILKEWTAAHSGSSNTSTGVCIISCLALAGVIGLGVYASMSRHSEAGQMTSFIG